MSEAKKDAAPTEAKKTKKILTPLKSVTTALGLVGHGTEITEAHLSKDRIAELKDKGRLVHISIEI